MRIMWAAALGLVISACASVPQASVSGWAGAWGASPTLPPESGRAFENQTVRQVVRLSQAGSSIRVRLTNEYGKAPLRIGSASVALAGVDGRLAGAPFSLTFAGQPSATIPPGAPLYSDPLPLDVNALDTFAISLYLPDPTGPCTCHFAGTATALISAPGDFTRTNFDAAQTFANRAFISAVEVQTPAPATLIAFGDSITDGTASTIDGNHRWPDVLAERLAAAGTPIAISNQAIAGNRVLTQGLPIFGESALARFDRDVMSVPNAKWLIMLEGINDIGMGAATPPSADEIIAGYRQVIARLHPRSVKVYLGTLLPYEGARYFHANGEAVRQQVNAWIRSTGEIDGVIDFDAVMRDPANPSRIKSELHSGDWLHPNDAGYKVMGEAVDLALFQ